MNQDDFKKLKELIEIIKHKVDMLSVAQTGQSAQISLIKDQLSMMNEKLDSHTGSLMNIEATLDAYADMYKVNNGNSKKLEKRIEVLEDNAGVIPPPELTLIDVK